MPGPDENFRPAMEEIRRQHDLQWSIDNAHDDKIGIILGFIFVVLLQIVLTSDMITTISKNILAIVSSASPSTIAINAVELGLFAAGLVFILGAAVIGMYAYRIQTYADIDITTHLERLRANEIDGAYFEKAVAHGLRDAFLENATLSARKARGIRWTFLAFFIGIVAFVARFVILVTVQV